MIVTHNILILDRPMSQKEKDVLHALSLCFSNPSVTDLIVSGLSRIEAIKCKIQIISLCRHVRKYYTSEPVIISYTYEEFHHVSDKNHGMDDKWLYHITSESDSDLSDMFMIANALNEIFDLDSEDFSSVTILSRRNGYFKGWFDPVPTVSVIKHDTHGQRRLTSKHTSLRSTDVLEYVARANNMTPEELKLAIDSICPLCGFDKDSCT